MGSSGRSRNRGRRDRQSEPAWLANAWDALVRPRGVGVILAIAGGAAIAAPWLNLPQRMGDAWWTRPLQAPSILQVVVLLVAVALPLAAGIAIQRARLDRQGEGEGADVVLTDLPPARLFGAAWMQWTPMVGLALMAVGGAGSIGVWLTLQRDVPPVQAALSVGERTEFVTGTISGRPVRVMLPRRAEVTNIEFGEEPGVEVAFQSAGERDATTQGLAPGESIDVDGKRFTFVGIVEDPNSLRAVIGGTRENMIETAAREGEEVAVALDGPTYTLERIELNYIGTMGPAVQLTSEESGPFWLFARSASEEFGPAFDHNLELRRLETLPAAVLTVAPELPFEPLFGFGVVFVIGLGAFFVFPEVRRRRRIGLVSVNEAGRLAQRFDVGEPTAHASAAEEEE